MEKTTAKFHQDMNIGEVLAMHPGAEKVIEKYFGGGCFTCPGIKTESIAFGALMHGIDLETIIKELNELEQAD